MEKVFLSFIASLFIVIVAVVLWVGTAYAPPPFPVPPKGGLPAQPICGDGVVEGTEDCDVSNLNGATCSTQGFLGGILACATGCTFDTSDCFATRFVDNCDGTVTDNMTGLMWEMKVAGSVCLHCVDDTYDWNTAMSEWISEVNGHTNDSTGSAQSGLGGYTDWRISNQAELLTIIDCSSGSPCIDPIFGPTAASIYWSATTVAGLPTIAWGVGFVNGGVSQIGKNINVFHVRAVRNSS